VAVTFLVSLPLVQVIEIFFEGVGATTAASWVNFTLIVGDEN
jgi:hypothetical protein